MFADFDLCLTVAEAIKIDGIPYEVSSTLTEWADRAFKCSDEDYEGLCTQALDVLLTYGVGNKWSRELILFWRASGGDPENRLGYVEHAPNMSSVETLPLPRKQGPKRVQGSAVSGKAKMLSGGLGSAGRSQGGNSGIFGSICN